MKRITYLILTLTFFSCSKKIKVEAIKAINSSVESTVTTINSGTVYADKQAELAFGAAGRIKNIQSSIGKIVNQNTIIAEIENSDLKAIYEEANNELNRSKKLFEDGLVSSSNLESSKRARDVAFTNYDKTIIKAPFKGMITALDLKVGEFYQFAQIANQRPKVQIIDLEKRYVKGEIDEVDLGKVKINQEARIKIPALKNAILKGVVRKVVPFISTAKDQDRTGLIELDLLDSSEFKDKALIPVGASADVEIVTEKKENSLVIPTSFIHGVGKNKFVYKVVNNKLTKTNIKIGVGNYDRSEIQEGLIVDDVIANPPEGIDDPSKLTIETEIKPWP
jgi:macrolide-specific efflux system membrane fusion protein